MPDAMTVAICGKLLGTDTQQRVDVYELDGETYAINEYGLGHEKRYYADMWDGDMKNVELV
jgi:hypothetical protein